MDAEHDGSDDEAAAMAAAMGFSSFGSHKPPAKKRKFNAATDAFVEGQELENIDKGGKKGQGSGGNMTKLGKQRIFGQPTEKGGDGTRRNNDEIELEGEGEESLQNVGMRNAKLAEGNADGGPQYLDTSLPAPAEAGTRYNEQEPAYTDTRTIPPTSALPDSISSTEAAEVQARIDALLDSIGSASVLPPPSNNSDSPSLLNPNRNLPSRPVCSDDSASMTTSRGGDGSSWGGSRNGRSRSGPGGGKGERNERWFETYYDPSFNYNPWGQLEKVKGLQPMGSWLQHTSQR
jgi:hypothetical protein